MRSLRFLLWCWRLLWSPTCHNTWCLKGFQSTAWWCLAHIVLFSCLCSRKGSFLCLSKANISLWSYNFSALENNIFSHDTNLCVMVKLLQDWEVLRLRRALAFLLSTNGDAPALKQELWSPLKCLSDVLTPLHIHNFTADTNTSLYCYLLCSPLIFLTWSGCLWDCV